MVRFKQMSFISTGHGMSSATVMFTNMFTYVRTNTHEHEHDTYKGFQTEQNSISIVYHRDSWLSLTAKRETQHGLNHYEIFILKVNVVTTTALNNVPK